MRHGDHDHDHDSWLDGLGFCLRCLRCRIERNPIYFNVRGGDTGVGGNGRFGGGPGGDSSGFGDDDTRPVKL
jgi:hypothetical protein